MCEIFNFERNGNSVRCETYFGEEEKKGSIKGVITTIGAQANIDNYSNRAKYLRKLAFNADRKILLIDFFYPLTESPNKEWFGFGKGIVCLTQFIEAVECCKIIIFTSVTRKDEKGIEKFLEKHGYICIDNGGNPDYIKVLEY